MVAILDERANQGKRYFEDMLATLPEMPVTSSLEDVAKFIRIAEESERGYNVNVLQAKGLLDAAACSAKLLNIEAKLTQLRRERRRLLKNEDIEEVMDTLRQTADLVHSGPERLDSFDEVLFADLVEKITAESTTRLRF